MNFDVYQRFDCRRTETKTASKKFSFLLNSSWSLRHDSQFQFSFYTFCGFFWFIHTCVCSIKLRSISSLGARWIFVEILDCFLIRRGGHGRLARVRKYVFSLFSFFSRVFIAEVYLLLINLIVCTQERSLITVPVCRHFSPFLRLPINPFFQAFRPREFHSFD